MATVQEALQAMKHENHKCLIVDKRHADDELGNLPVSDIARQVLGKNGHPIA